MPDARWVCKGCGLGFATRRATVLIHTTGLAGAERGSVTPRPST